jgi:hypothetical protein
MMRRLLRFLALPVLVLSLATPAIHAQTPPVETEKSERSVSALPYAVLVIYTLAVLTIVCMPSRKA